jgi:hypothetical protein
MLKLSELEKSILLAFLALTKATAGKFLRKMKLFSNMLEGREKTLKEQSKGF